MLRIPRHFNGPLNIKRYDFKAIVSLWFWMLGKWRTARCVSGACERQTGGESDALIYHTSARVCSHRL